MKFCTHCGNVLDGHSFVYARGGRGACSKCKTPAYDHPRVIVSCFIYCKDKLLWIQRKLEPRKGYWAAPGGFLEVGEILAEGAAREVREESGICLDPDSLHFYMTGSITPINQVYVSFRAEVTVEDCMPGDEALSVAFFDRKALPWTKLAYPELDKFTHLIYDDIESGQFGVYQGEFTAENSRLDPVQERPVLGRPIKH